MKIAVIAKTRFPIAEPFTGGLESFTHTLCAEYKRRGHDVTLYAHKESDPTLNLKSFYGYDIRKSEFVDIYENDEYLSILKDITDGSYDIVHNNSTSPLPIIWGAKATQPVVTTLHTPPYTALKAATSLASYSNNLKFVAVSKSLEKTWQPFLNNGSSVIYNGISLTSWPLQREDLRYVFWFGRITESKGLDIAIDAAHEIDLPIYFAGVIADQMYYDTQIKPRLHRDDRYVGHLRQNELSEKMRHAAVFACPPRWEEPFGLSTVEAMASGVPVAGYDRGAFRELVSLNSGVIADGTNVTSLAQAMRKAMMLKSDDVRQQAELFPLRKTVEQYLRYFEELV